MLEMAGGGDVRKGMKSPPAMFLAWVIYGHHGGLKDRETLKSSLGEAVDAWHRDAAADAFCAGIEPPGELPQLPDWLRDAPSQEAFARSYEFFVRMMYSALVDADFLDTERYFAMTGSKEAEASVRARALPMPTLQEAWAHLEAKLADLDAKSAGKGNDAVQDVNALRRQVRSACLEAAGLPPGLFSLTVPTGGAKTLGSLAFSIQHALRHDLRRVIVAVPFTSITEQTAAVFRDFLPSGAVLEHHSNLDPSKETAQSRAASENWDMPVIVTTQVQLFESLLANRSSRCRKLHNLSRSVLVLDEVQSLPAPYLLPVLDLLGELAQHYGTTVLLTTATQPELHARQLGGVHFRGLSSEPREIIPESLAGALWSKLRRVRVHWPDEWGGDLKAQVEPWEALAERMAESPQALAICHLKADALALAQALEAHGISPFHLSTAMCPAHRRKVLASIKERLDRGEDCHLVSTQLIEAGVDVDFPVVYRAMAGLEALAQSAGRCNRNGRLAPDLGDFFIFEAPTEPPRDLVPARDVARDMLLNGLPDLLVPETFVDYFGRLHAAKGNLLDLHGIHPLRESLKFEQVADRTRLVDSPAIPVFVPYDEEAREAIDALRWRGPSRQTLRRLQPYTVNLFPNQLKAIQEEGALQMLHDFRVLVSDLHYHPQYGLRTRVDAANALIC